MAKMIGLESAVGQVPHLGGEVIRFSSRNSLIVSSTYKMGKGLVIFKQFLGCAESAKSMCIMYIHFCREMSHTTKKLLECH